MNWRLVIVGARAMGREVCSYAQESGIEVKGFLDDNVNALDGFVGYPPILDSVEKYVIAKEDLFIVALGEPDSKLKYAKQIAEKGGRFTSVVHPSAYVGENVKLGVGCIVCPHSTITNDTILGEHVIVNVNVSISHDNRIGDYVTICPGCHLAGRVNLERLVFIGTGVSLIPDVCLGEGVYVAAGAIVTKSFDYGCLMGVPAKRRSI